MFYFCFTRTGLVMSPAGPNTRRIVVLGKRGPIVERVLLLLSLRGVVPEALILSRSTHPPYRRELLPPAVASAARSPRRLVAGILRRALRRLETTRAADDSDSLKQWRGFARHVHEVRSPHEETTTQLLRDLLPDYVVLADCGIVGENVLNIPRLGTLNSHPALLPWTRGLGVTRCLERGVPIGVTAHFVDTSIDTGPIIHRELVPVHDADTLASLHRKAHASAVQLLCDVVVSAAAGKPPSSVGQQRRFAYAKWPSSAEQAGLEQAVRDGLALRLYHNWLEKLGSHALPPDDRDCPGVDLEPRILASEPEGQDR